MTAALVRADAVAFPLVDGSVDAVMFSPPYFSLRDYKDDGGDTLEGQIGSEPSPHDYLDAMVVVMRECVRVAKPGASIFVNIGDKYGRGDRPMYAGDSNRPNAGMVKYTPERATPERAKSLVGLPWRFAIRCMDELDLVLRAEIVWSKPNGLPESVTDRVRRAHEQIFHFTLDTHYTSSMDEIREPHAEHTLYCADWEQSKPGGIYIRDRHNSDRQDGGNRTSVGGPNPLGKIPGSVWSIPSEPLQVPDYFVEDDHGWRMVDADPLGRYVRHRVEGGDWSPVMVRPIDHFAAWPSEIPRRLILGWTPNGICKACGTGRLPTTTITTRTEVRGEDKYLRRERGDGRAGARASQTADITGYACACDEPTSPTRPAVVLDPFAGTGTTVMTARALGRFGIGFDLSADYLRLARWRVWQSGGTAKVAARTNRDRQGVLL